MFCIYYNINRIFTISGEFYFTPNQFYSLKNTLKETYATLPGSLKQTELKSHVGYASYGLQISGLKPNLVYMIKVPHVTNACSIVVNSIDLGRQGQPGTDEETCIPGTKASAVAFKSRADGTADFILNVSNFRNRKSGFSLDMMIGTANVMENFCKKELVYSATIFSLLFAVALFFFLLSFYYRQTSFTLWIALAVGIIAIRGIFFYPHLIVVLHPTLNWRFAFIMRYITFPLPIIFFTVFIKKALKLYYKIPYFLIIGLSTVYAVSTIFVSPKFSASILFYYQVIALVSTLYSIVITVMAVIQKKDLAIWVSLSILILFISGFYDLLIGMNIISGQFSISTGATLSVLLISYSFCS